MVVLLHDKNMPPLNWKLGRVTCAYPGEDGLVRAVDVFTGGTIFRRPINRLSVLPIEENRQTSVPNLPSDLDAKPQRGEYVSSSTEAPSPSSLS